jgi:hypothetical protein
LSADKLILLNLCKTVIYNDPTRNCIIKGSTDDWDELPNNKSLFHSPHNCGLPIGNLTSQIFANFYLNTFDHFIKNKLAVRFYGRYVDDCVLVHQSEEYLKYLLNKLRNFLKSDLKLELHPKKIYLQHHTKGVKFLGAIIKPNRIYISNRTKGNFYAAIMKQNDVIDNSILTKEKKDAFLCSMNSYLGIMRQYKSYDIRINMIIKHLSYWWWYHVYLDGKATKFIMRRRGWDAKQGLAIIAGNQPLLRILFANL